MEQNEKTKNLIRNIAGIIVSGLVIIILQYGLQATEKRNMAGDAKRVEAFLEAVKPWVK